MRLTEREILSILKGAPAARINGDRVIPERFTALQRTGYPSDLVRYPRVDCHKATLDFFTDAEAVTVGYADAWTGPDPALFSFDVLENGVLTSHLGTDVSTETVLRAPDGAATAGLRPGKKRVTVYLPAFFHVEITHVELVGATFFRPYVHPGRFLAFGDSITEGFHAVRPSMTYVNQLSRLLDREAVNYAVDGEISRPGTVTPGTYPDCDFVLAAYGTNDSANRKVPATFGADLSDFHRRLHEAFADKPVFILLPIWRKTAEKVCSLGTLQDISQRISESAADYPNFHVVDCIDLIPHDLNLFHDGVHPLDRGMEYYALGLEPEIRKVMGW